MLGIFQEYSRRAKTQELIYNSESSQNPSIFSLEGSVSVSSKLRFLRHFTIYRSKIVTRE